MAATRPAGKPPRQVPVEIPPHVQQLLGAEADELLDALKLPPPVSIRLNPSKPTDVQGEPVPWCSQGRYLPERPRFTLDPLLHAGAYYVQEASSMMLGQALRACTTLPRNPIALDLCAAPGGKSTHLAALLPREALLISNEPVPNRQAALAENLWKWGHSNSVVTGAEPAAFLPMGPFCNLVLVDAPCSGEGMFRKDPQARAQWGPNLVKTCATRQQHILDAAWDLLAPGGFLVYSTCTWETCENEDQVHRLVQRGAEHWTIPIDPQWGVSRSNGGLRCWPHRVRGEGFFLALLHKPGAAVPQGGAAPPDALPHPADQWLHDPEAFRPVERGHTLFAVGARWHSLVSRLARTVRCIAPGSPVAVHKGGTWMPHPALALNGMLDHGQFNLLDLDSSQALGFLRGEPIPATHAAGTALVRYRNLGLGWVHGAGNRWNNRWPPEWRIRLR